jgi:hypothetical protein
VQRIREHVYTPGGLQMKEIIRRWQVENIQFNDALSPLRVWLVTSD